MSAASVCQSLTHARGRCRRLPGLGLRRMPGGGVAAQSQFAAPLSTGGRRPRGVNGHRGRWRGECGSGGGGSSGGWLVSSREVGGAPVTVRCHGRALVTELLVLRELLSVNEENSFKQKSARNKKAPKAWLITRTYQPWSRYSQRQWMN